MIAWVSLCKTTDKTYLFKSCGLAVIQGGFIPEMQRLYVGNNSICCGCFCEWLDV